MRTGGRSMTDTRERSHLVGPVLGGTFPELIEAVKAAAVLDNPPEEVVVEDRDGYVRVHAPRQFRLRRETLSAVVGRPFDLPEIEPAMPAFAGRLKQTRDEWIWYIEHADGEE
jgi:toluene monooxygenase system protein D